jgi:uncharacterized membrane protein YdjX (TVP38/TMEM64 family)
VEQPDSSALQQKQSSLMLLRVGTLLVFVAGLVAYCVFPTLRAQLYSGVVLLLHGDLIGLRAWTAQFGLWAPLASLFLMIVQALAAPIPAILITAVNSLLFGPFLGGLLSIVSATIAAAVCFLLARSLGAPFVSRLVSQTVLQRTNAFMAQHGTAAVLIARLIPVVPFDPISYAAGLTEMRLSAFCWTTLVGQIPAGMTYSYLGQDIYRPGHLMVKGVGAFLGLLILGWTVRHVVLRRHVFSRQRHRQGKAPSLSTGTRPDCHA